MSPEQRASALILLRFLPRRVPRLFPDPLAPLRPAILLRLLPPPQVDCRAVFEEQAQLWWSQQAGGGAADAGSALKVGRVASSQEQRNQLLMVQGARWGRDPGIRDDRRRALSARASKGTGAEKEMG